MVGTDDLLSRLFLEEPRHCRHCSNSTVLANDDDEKALTFLFDMKRLVEYL